MVKLAALFNGRMCNVCVGTGTRAGFHNEIEADTLGQTKTLQTVLFQRGNCAAVHIEPTCTLKQDNNRYW